MKNQQFKTRSGTLEKDVTYYVFVNGSNGPTQKRVAFESVQVEVTHYSDGYCYFVTPSGKEAFTNDFWVKLTTFVFNFSFYVEGEVNTMEVSATCELEAIAQIQSKFPFKKVSCFQRL